MILASVRYGWIVDQRPFSTKPSSKLLLLEEWARNGFWHNLKHSHMISIAMLRDSCEFCMTFFCKMEQDFFEDEFCSHRGKLAIT